MYFGHQSRKFFLLNNYLYDKFLCLQDSSTTVVPFLMVPVCLGLGLWAQHYSGTPLKGHI